MKGARFVAWAYVVVAICAAGWALAVDALYFNSPIEHNLPNLMLVFVGAPLSELMLWLLEALPESLFEAVSSVWIQLPLMLSAAALQAAGLLWLTRSARK